MTAVWLLAALVLVAGNGFFVSVEFASVGARRTLIDKWAREGRRGAARARLLQENLMLTLGGAQLGVTVCSLALGRIAEPAVGSMLEAGFESAGVSESLRATLSFIIALTVVVVIHTWLGEMAAKNLTITHPERTLVIVARPMAAFIRLSTPAIRLLLVLSNGALRLMGVEPRSELDGAVTAAELYSMVSESAAAGLIDEEDRGRLAGALEFGSTAAADVMTPMPEVDAVSRMATVAEVESELVDTDHTRLVVYDGDLDHITGFIHSKDLLDVGPTARNRPIPLRRIRPMLRVNADTPLPEVLLAMRNRRVYLALVVDDEGDSRGVVTLDDVLAALVDASRTEVPPRA